MGRSPGTAAHDVSRHDAERERDGSYEGLSRGASQALKALEHGSPASRIKCCAPTTSRVSSRTTPHRPSPSRRRRCLKSTSDIWRRSGSGSASIQFSAAPCRAPHPSRSSQPGSEDLRLRAVASIHSRHVPGKLSVHCGRSEPRAGLSGVRHERAAIWHRLPRLDGQSRANR
jgi:hypothetical protein